MRPSHHDLINSGRLPPGIVIFHPNGRREDTAVSPIVTKDGIRLGNRTFVSPSTSAKAVAGYAVNGWYFWRLKDSGEPLQSVRPWRDT